MDPMKGQSAGYCAGFGVPMNAVAGRGVGRSAGWGRALRSDGFE